MYDLSVYEGKYRENFSFPPGQKKESIDCFIMNQNLIASVYWWYSFVISSLQLYLKCLKVNLKPTLFHYTKEETQKVMCFLNSDGVRPADISFNVKRVVSLRSNSGLISLKLPCFSLY